MLSEELQKGEFDMRVPPCFMRTSHNIPFSSEDDSALLTSLKQHKYFFRNCKFHPDGRIQFYKGLRADDTPNTRLTLCCKPYVTKCDAFARHEKCIIVILHCNGRPATVPVHINLQQTVQICTSVLLTTISQKLLLLCFQSNNCTTNGLPEAYCIHSYNRA